MTEMWLIRHGQTDWNLANIVQGQADIPLNETGIKQAESLARELHGTHFDIIYTSDLSRALQTAGIIAKEVGAPVVIDRRLREIRQGVWEGLSFEEIKNNFGPISKPNSKNLTIPRAPGAETAAEVITRMVEVANEIHARHNGERVLLCSHGFALAVLFLVARSMPLDDIFPHIPDNGQPLVIEVISEISLPIFQYSK